MFSYSNSSEDEILELFYTNCLYNIDDCILAIE